MLHPFCSSAGSSQVLRSSGSGRLHRPKHTLNALQQPHSTGLCSCRSSGASTRLWSPAMWRWQSLHTWLRCQSLASERIAKRASPSGALQTCTSASLSGSLPACQGGVHTRSQLLWADGKAIFKLGVQCHNLLQKCLDCAGPWGRAGCSRAWRRPSSCSAHLQALTSRLHGSSAAQPASCDA